MAAESPSVFSVRLVCIDYYMSPPIPGVDIPYSSFQGGMVTEVPVIRVYGPTPAGQKTCLHIHKAFPYLYVPICDVKLDAHREGEAYANSIARALEKALKLKGNAGSKRQHVHGYSLVRAKKFYGYHSSEELFVKIYLYHPQDVSRAANLLLGGAVLEKTLQPHESHIPFILQFMVDYNLYGMSHVHLSKMRFRHPVPSSSTGKKFSCSEQHHELCIGPSSCCSASREADTGSGGSFGSPLWTSSTIPHDWTWHIFTEPGASLAQEFQHIRRQSTCELEGDATIDEIINQQFKNYTSLSQTGSDVKMVQSLIPIWEEEHHRAGMHETTIPPDLGKPLPEDVLKTLLNNLEFELKLQELCCRTDDGPILSDATMRGSLSSDKQGLADPDNVNSIYTDEQTAVGVSDQQVADTEALSLLRWLATSQAAEDINSDDELVRETILSPLMPATTMDKVLEKANTDYESESQKECQDILDSIKDIREVNCLKEKTSIVCETMSKKQPPQMNDFNLCLSTAISEVDTKGEMNQQSILPATSRIVANNIKRKRPLWGSLPFTMNQKVDFDSEDGRSPAGKVQFSLADDFLGTVMANNEGEVSSTGADVCESRSLVGCTLRDLMRKKRRLRVSEQDNVLVCDRKFVLGAEEEGGCLLSKRLDFHTPHEGGCLLSKGLDFHTPHGGEHVENTAASETFMPNDEDSSPDLSAPQSDKHNVSTNSTKQQLVNGADCIPSSLSDLEKVPAESCGQQSGPLYISSQAGLLTGHDEYSLCMIKPLHSTFLQNKNVHASELAEMDTSLCSLLHKINDREPQPSLGRFEGNEEVKHSTIQLDHKIQQEGLMDVSVHYQNDGSLLYPLTPSWSPPSADSVNRWLLHSCQDAPGETNAAVSGALATGGSSKFEMNSSCVDQNDDVVLSSSISDCTPTLDHVQQDKDHNSKEKFQTCNDEEISAWNPENVVSNVTADCAMDLSQISGPDGKSRSTPLSQTGFRDPASVGAGQQLTLLSVEVLAETRADLQPDPRCDTINLISLVFQCDSDSAVEAYVLLRSNANSYHKNFDGVFGCKLLVRSEESGLFDDFIRIINLLDPDILMGWDVQGGSLGFLAERAAHLGIGLLHCISRTPTEMNKDSEEPKALDSGVPETVLHELLVSSSPAVDGVVIQDEWGRTHASGVHVSGRVILNIWRLMRGEVKLTMYNIEDVGGAVLRRKIPSIPNRVLTRWFSSGTARARYKCIEYVTGRAKLNLEIMNQLDMVNRTSELARVFGIDFFSVLSRGSQYRVESMLLRLAHTQNYLAISPGSHQVASQPAMECLPLVMEPKSGFYADPVIVLDFQSLYPSMIIAYNLCFSTCLGNVIPAKSNVLGVSSYTPDPVVLQDLKDDILLTPNGVMYVPSKIRKGILPRLLEEILSTRIMVKQAMKKLAPSEQVLYRIFNARQLALKLIANVTYGYTAAGFSGRMPCAELADTIVQCGRCTLERAIALINANDNWKAKVIYGDTDSMFVLLKGRSVQESFQIGRQIASAVTAMNPDPVTLKLEKVYHPCFLLTKKRYVGYSYESPEQIEPLFDAKGIETVRRDACGVVAKMMEKSLRLFFENQDILELKAYIQRQWKRILSGRVSIQDFVFAKEVRLGTYSTRVSSLLPPAAIVASKAMKVDPRAEPRYAERVPYVVIHGEPGARLVDMVVAPWDLLAIDSPYRLNDLYYITKQIIPALQRVFGLVGADLNKWFFEMPRPTRETSSKRPISAANPNKTRIDYYYLSKHCILCGELVHASAHLCHECLQNEASAATVLIGRTSKLEKEIQHLAAICRQCGGGDWLVESGVKCTSLACSVFYERRKVQKELQGISAIAGEKGMYPKCMIEWF